MEFKFFGYAVHTELTIYFPTHSALYRLGVCESNHDIYIYLDVHVHNRKMQTSFFDIADQEKETFF
jgi:hypothetical protein